jgi:hypothetical protein
MEEIDIFGMTIGMVFKIRAPKSNVWGDIIAVFR